MTHPAKLPDHRPFGIVSRSPGADEESSMVSGGRLPDPRITDACRLRSLVDSVQAGVLVEDTSCHIVLANQAFCDLLEIHESAESLVGWEARMVFEAIQERFETPDDVLARTEALIAQQVESLSETIALVGGRTLERDFLPIRSEDEYGGHFWIFRDITPHVAAEEKLRRSGERLRMLSEITTELGDGHEDDFSRALGRVAALLGLNLGLIARVEGGEVVVEHVHPREGAVRSGCRAALSAFPLAAGLDASRPALGVESVSRAFGPQQPLVAGGAVPEACIAALVPGAEGPRRIVSMAGMAPRSAPWSEADLDLVRLFAQWIGKTLERRRDKEELRESEERYRDFIENTSALVCIHDLDGIVLAVNRAVVDSLGMEGPAQIVGRDLSEIVAPETRNELDRYLEEIALAGHHTGTMVVVGADGRRRVFSFDNSVRRDGVERPVVRGLGQDITARYEARQALRQRVELEKLLLSISTSFINLPTSAIAATIQQALGLLGEFVGADVCFVFLLEDERRTLARRYAWIGTSDLPVAAPERIDTTELSSLVQTISRLSPFSVDRPEDLPASAAAEREHFARYGLRSLLALPIASRGELLGFVGLAAQTREIEWREEVVSIFRVVGDILGGALDRKASAEALEKANARLQASNRELAWTNGRMAMLNEMGDLLQSSTDREEAHAVIQDLAPRVCPGTAGIVYLLGDNRQRLEPIVSWGADEEGPLRVGTLVPNDCWALRRGRPYRIGSESPGPICRHVSDCPEVDTLCLPLLAQGEALGILTLRGLSSEGPEGWSQGAEQLALSAAEHMALGLANLKLRESLREQAVRDPLTGLFNRRYLEEQFVRELGRADRHGAPIAVLMVDIDRFKRINDTHGHEGGDRTLVEVASLLSSRVRAEDVVARYGGEEFTLLLAGTDLVDAVQVAEGLRTAVLGLRVSSQGARIDGLSVSIGVAAYPECGRSQEELLRLADGALYRAKESGRDRVVAACLDPEHPASRPQRDRPS